MENENNHLSRISQLRITNRREYNTWQNMIQRCVNPKHTFYRYYGGAGVTVCERWRKSFENFFDDMGERPEGMSLDRIDPNGNYEPANCRWATAEVQNGNRRNCRNVLIDGEHVTAIECARRIGMSVPTVYRWLKIGKLQESHAKPNRFAKGEQCAGKRIEWHCSKLALRSNYRRSQRAHKKG